jgi:trans-aconitate 2-methyltransferase
MSRDSATDSWDPTQYNRFAAEREQPFWDLAALLRRDGSTARPHLSDLGCGDGRLTAALGRHLDAGSVLGVDSSPAMIEAAAPHADPDRSLRFALCDIATWSPERPVDIVYANASLQWVPDHPVVLRRWTEALTAGGQLAVQIPANADHPSHLVAAEVAAEFRDEPPPDTVAANVLRPEDYSVLLHELGFREQHVRLQVYAHELSHTEDFVEWVKGTTLTRFKAPLGPQRWDEFVERYRGRLLEVLGDHEPFLYPFKRILFWGRL